MRIVNWTIDLTLRLAARRAPSALADRLVEEWRAEVDAIPGAADKVVFVAGLLFKGDGALPGHGSQVRRLGRLLVPATLCALIAYGGSLVVPHSFIAEASMTAAPPLPPSSDATVRRIATTPIDEGVIGIRRTILRPVDLARVIAEFNLYPALRRSTPMPEVVDAMQRAIDIQVSSDGDENSRLRVAIRFRYENASVAGEVTERLRRYLIMASTEDPLRLIDGTMQFLQGQVREARRRLEEAEARGGPRQLEVVERLAGQQRSLVTKQQTFTSFTTEQRRSIQARFKVTGPPVVERVPGRSWFVVAGAALGLCLGAVMILSGRRQASDDVASLPEA